MPSRYESDAASLAEFFSGVAARIPESDEYTLKVPEVGAAVAHSGTPSLGREELNEAVQAVLRAFWPNAGEELSFRRIRFEILRLAITAKAISGKTAVLEYRERIGTGPAGGVLSSVSPPVVSESDRPIQAFVNPEAEIFLLAEIRHRIISVMNENCIVHPSEDMISEAGLESLSNPLAAAVAVARAENCNSSDPQIVVAGTRPFVDMKLDQHQAILGNMVPAPTPPMAACTTECTLFEATITAAARTANEQGESDHPAFRIYYAGVIQIFERYRHAKAARTCCGQVSTMRQQYRGLVSIFTEFGRAGK